MAFEFTGNDARANIDPLDGGTYVVSVLIGPDENAPEDIESSQRYIAVPDKRDLDLGRSPVLAFVAPALPDDCNRAVEMFRRKGALWSVPAPFA